MYEGDYLLCRSSTPLADNLDFVNGVMELELELELTRFNGHLIVKQEGESPRV